MADVYTQVSSLSSVGTAAHERLAYFALRDELYFDQAADVKPTAQTHPGASVTWYLYADLAAATTALNEITDSDTVGVSDSTVTLTLAEYGNAVRTTARARAEALLELDADVANIVGYNAGLSVDTLARTQLEGGANVIYGGTATATANIAATDTLGASNIREAVAALRGANVRPWGGLYTAYIHPDQSVDLREETGAAGWAEAANQSAADRVWNGMVGTYAGARIIEAPRVSITADGGAVNVDAYLSVVVGQEALAKAHGIKDGYGPQPQIVVGPQTDNLRRINTIGWKHLVAYGRFREASIQRIETASSIGAN